MPHDGVMSDLMWSDPEESIEGFSLSPRGAGLLIYLMWLPSRLIILFCSFCDGFLMNFNRYGLSNASSSNLFI